MSSTSSDSGLPRPAAWSTSGPRRLPLNRRLWPPAGRRLVDQRAEMALHVAAIVQPGERVGDRHLDRLLDVVAQPFAVALLADLRARARHQFVPVDRPHE